MVDDPQQCMICQLPHALEYCIVALSFVVDQDRNEEQSSYNGGVKHVGCNRVGSYYDDALKCDDNNNNIHDRR